MYDCNILRVAAGTTGACGGDSGHGGRTRIEIEDLGGTDIEFEIEPGKRQVNIILGGDSELGTIIEGLRFVVETLEAESTRARLIRDNHSYKLP